MWARHHCISDGGVTLLSVLLALAAQKCSWRWERRPGRSWTRREREVEKQVFAPEEIMNEKDAREEEL